VPLSNKQTNGVNTAEQKKLCLYTGSSFPIRYINFKINFNFNIDDCTPLKLDPSTVITITPNTWIQASKWLLMQSIMRCRFPSLSRVVVSRIFSVCMYLDSITHSPPMTFTGSFKGAPFKASVTDMFCDQLRRERATREETAEQNSGRTDRQ